MAGVDVSNMKNTMFVGNNIYRTINSLQKKKCGCKAQQLRNEAWTCARGRRRLGRAEAGEPGNWILRQNLPGRDWRGDPPQLRLRVVAASDKPHVAIAALLAKHSLARLEAVLRDVSQSPTCSRSPPGQATDFTVCSTARGG